ncbi:ATP-dependent DEAD/H DNA helicase recQ family- like protein [Leptomonas pyrrhocoris]|uniref:DNA 3'-5' helicase n=1 Tax=Leptomonas pyrrhocoris TaxID=157538 RepID=A0A0M9G6B9_LEPPY|nr:ATP-dependent DEAD/H DNA helicase recQ family- like protein [Leptomonas pyrrhocoris]KPA83287.1 ATP-dependent DEAD/H DNA helicase recQ family- like protein [Leptomonas pyrrhocoris]|eukprot:XP_015661726.1 ATP-dependent DEAD/H DNA helicase recQ family- like protein [Leptomonas pyrrhocoris]
MPLSTVPALTVPEKRKRSRSASSNESTDGDHDDGSRDEAEEAVPFLTTLSMNQTHLFYGLKNVQSRAPDAPAQQSAALSSRANDESNVGAPSSPGEEAAASPVHAARKLVPNAADTTYLHSMLQEIVAAAAQFSAASTSPVPQTAHDDDTLPACAYLLRTYFHFASGSFKPRQQAVCFSILSGLNTLAVCPTGWGKSLCYQFPMLVHRLLFECRYEQWCRQAGVVSVLTQRDYSNTGGLGTDDADALHAPSSNAADVALPSTLCSRFCVVVSPLLALMEDQAERINGVAHLSAFVLSSKVDAAREAQLFRELASPLCPLDILFVSPEKLISNVGLRLLLRSQRHRLAMLCVDEVHCVSGWAYDFRPTFMYISRVLDDPVLDDAATFCPSTTFGKPLAAPRGQMPCSPVPQLCLTATATFAVTRDVQRRFSIQRTFLCADQRRANLELQSVDLVARHVAFHNVRATRDDAGHNEVPEPSSRVVQDALLEAVRQLPKPMLMYVQSRAEADELSGLLSAKLAREKRQSSPPTSPVSSGEASSASTSASFTECNAQRNSKQVRSDLFHATHYAKAEEEVHDSSETADGSTHARCSSSTASRIVVRCYHAALTRSVRTATQRQFLDGKIDVLVATVAFGMGIDKANIRSVVHASAPSSLEGYVQEIGRAGRDGERSVCRILYNPFDFYSLRSRLWTSLLSPAEMRSIVAAILNCPTTRVGQRLMLVSTAALSSELGFSEEAVETVLFLLLTEVESPGRPLVTDENPLHHNAEGRSSTGRLHAPFRTVLGSYPLKYKVVSVQGEAEQDGAPAATVAAVSTSSSASSAIDSQSRYAATKRRRTRCSASAAASAGVGLLLRQLGATDAVLELCRVMPSTSNQIELANRLSMPLVEFRQRMQDLIQSGTVKVARYGVPTALLLELADSFADAASPAGQAALAEYLWSLHRGRLDAQVRRLREMFRVLARPTPDDVASVFRGESLDGPSVNGVPEAPRWSPPGRGCGKMRAVSIANAFVEENRLRIHSTYEALRALMGVRPKSLIQYGKYAGQLPLAQSWYVSSPYFGALRTFDLAWVLQILAPHRLDSAVSEK